MAINWNEYPKRSLVAKIDESVVTKLPDNYAGTNSDVHLADAFTATLNRKTFNQITRTPDAANALYITDTVTNGKKFVSFFSKYALDTTDENIYWDFLNIIGTPSLTVNQISYLVNLAAHFKGRELAQMFSTVNSIIVYQRKNLDVATANLTLPTIEAVENLYRLGEVLRAEGVVMETQYLWVASSHWDTDEVITLIGEGMPIARALQLYQLGYESIDEIVNYGAGAIPESWLDRIFSDDFDDEDDFMSIV